MSRILFAPGDILPYLQEHRIPSFRWKQIQHAIFRESITSIDEMSTLPKELREQLVADGFCVSTLTVQEIVDGPESTKFLFSLPDGNVIETVVMYHRHQTWAGKQRKILRSWTGAKISPETHTLNRITICISSQVWCAVWCIFCVTGKLWFKKNLHWTEMIMQLLLVNAHIKERFGKKEDGTRHRLRNVVFMGMWEPLLNYQHMKDSIDVMLDQQAFGLSKRHITISTSGVASAIQQLVDDQVDVRLALSLHAPEQKLREELIPMIAKRRPIDELMRTIDAYTHATNNRVFYEYIMIQDKTDTPDIAHQLGKLLQSRNAHVNLIPYNENPAMPTLTTSDFDVILAFKKIVASYGVTVTVRDTLGRDVKWACGQLGYEKVQASTQK